MKTGKYDDILDRIDSMPNWQVFLCCRALVILLDRELTTAYTSLRPRELVELNWEIKSQYLDLLTQFIEKKLIF